MCVTKQFKSTSVETLKRINSDFLQSVRNGDKESYARFVSPFIGTRESNKPLIIQMINSDKPKSDFELVRVDWNIDEKLMDSILKVSFDRGRIQDLIDIYPDTYLQSRCIRYAMKEENKEIFDYVFGLMVNIDIDIEFKILNDFIDDSQFVKLMKSNYSKNHTEEIYLNMKECSLKRLMIMANFSNYTFDAYFLIKKNYPGYVRDFIKSIERHQISDLFSTAIVFDHESFVRDVLTYRGDIERSEKYLFDAISCDPMFFKKKKTRCCIIKLLLRHGFRLNDVEKYKNEISRRNFGIEKEEIIDVIEFYHLKHRMFRTTQGKKMIYSVICS